MIEVRRGERYRHKRTGGTYHVIALARIEATLTQAVVYRKVDAATWNDIPDKDANTWVRPLTEFADGRFELVTEKTT